MSERNSSNLHSYGFMVVETVAIIFTFGAKQAATITFPFHLLTRVVSIGEFLGRLDALMIVAWVPIPLLLLIVAYLRLPTTASACKASRLSKE